MTVEERVDSGKDRGFWYFENLEYGTNPNRQNLATDCKANGLVPKNWCYQSLLKRGE